VLTVEEQLFVRSYIIDRNEVAAMRRLGYNKDNPTLKRWAERHLSNPEVQGAIAKLAKTMMERLQVEADNVNRGVAAIAFTDATEILHYDGMHTTILPTHLWPEHAKKAVAGIKAGQFGVEVKFYDKQRSLEFLSKQLGLNRDEENAAIATANAAANMAISKILDVVARKQDLLPARVVESEIIDV
jgi:phage terminase small subunit